ALREAGAPVQRPLWASTGVKNPHYPETKYVDSLVGPHTVNTMPMATLLAAAEKSEITGVTAAEDPSADLKALADAGVDLDEVTAKLLKDGIAAFVTPFEKLLAGVESTREATVTGRPKTIESLIPDELEAGVAARAKKAVEDDVAQRVWRKDETLWAAAGTPEIENRLGWLTITEPLQDAVPALIALRESCVADGLTDVVLLGMGGSSLAPEVFRRSFGPLDGGLRLHVLDSTDSATVLAVGEAIDVSKTIFIVSSKSGGTIEPNSFFSHFHEQVVEAVGADSAGSHFIAITDPGTSLVDLAAKNNFRQTFQNDPDIGGRYSALSFFGLVPAALMGADVEAILDGAQVAEQACANYDSSASNQGLWMGIALGELATQGRDKLTFVVDEPIASFGLWAEQLVAESTGKLGKGLLPVADEPLGDPSAYGDDRVFVHLANRDEPDSDNEEAMVELAKAGHPVITLKAGGPEDLGRIFFFSEFATAVAGWALEINPFDQPNVQEAKDNTNRVLDEFAANGALPEVENATDEALQALLGQAGPPHYVAIMGYLEPSDEFDAAVAELRAVIRDGTKATTTYGYGPRFLHSTGQFHKGGPAVGIFLQLIHDGPDDAEIPGQGFGFTTLKNAQATGDLQTLRSHGLPAERVRFDGDPVAGVRELAAKIKGML
ncbi:MAG: transaldolase / glucose-6-phosphate isomerase, partial [Thermoleophilaceae bacterium]|nr:transaldolase / glucose-6-phosphate isomerase [Thermoleophilaceae bacterium]